MGEQVKCLVMGLDPGYTNISLSIAGGCLPAYLSCRPGCRQNSNPVLRAPLKPTRPSSAAAELEVEDGDVLSNKQRVWDSAESQAAVFRAQLEEYREQGGYEEEEAELA